MPIQIYFRAAVVEGEAKALSDRKKTAVAAAKARGSKLGTARLGHFDGREDIRLAGLEKALKVAATTNAQATNEAYADILPMMKAMWEHRR